MTTKASLLEICSCVDDEVVERVFQELKKCASENPYDSSFESQLVRVYLEKLDLIEHGTAIRGSWLTPSGRTVLDQLEKKE